MIEEINMDRLDRIEKILNETTKGLKLLKDRQLKTDEQLKKTDEQLKKTDEQQRKTDEELRKTDEQQRKTNEEISRVSREIGGGLGRMAEGLTAPSIPKLFAELGIKVKHVFQRVRTIEDGKCIGEIDLVCPARRNGKEVVLLGEVKAHLTSTDIKDFLPSIEHFKEYFPEYKEAEIITLVSGMYVAEEAKRFAYKKGCYILAPAEDTMQILNPKDFKPKVY
ncbi:MAG: hypothetical protein AB1422_00525 [bacterium]